jgi:hypothetical protein
MKASLQKTKDESEDILYSTEKDYNQMMIENEKKKLKDVQGYYVGDSSYAAV